MLFKKRNTEKGEPVMVAAIMNTVSSEIFQDILKNNQIPFICRQQGAGGYLKIVTGGLFSTDCIYVNEEDYSHAKELYDIYIESQDFTDSEED